MKRIASDLLTNRPATWIALTCALLAVLGASLWAIEPGPPLPRAAPLDKLRKIPGLEVEIQTATGTQVFRTVKLPPFVYRTINVGLVAPLARTVVINLNGGGEAGLFGAVGFLQHRWAKDIRAYL